MGRWRAGNLATERRTSKHGAQASGRTRRWWTQEAAWVARHLSQLGWFGDDNLLQPRSQTAWPHLR